MQLSKFPDIIFLYNQLLAVAAIGTVCHVNSVPPNLFAKMCSNLTGKHFDNLVLTIYV